MNKRNIFLWALYDFANSIVMIVFMLYFSQWLVIDKGVSDFWYNASFIFSTILLILTGPVVSVLADKKGRCFSFFYKNTVILYILYILLTFIILFFPEQRILAIVLFILGNFAYQSSFIFYNSFLNEISQPEKRGFTSGIGNAANWLGQIAGLLLVLPFVSGSLYLFGETGRAQVFLPAVVFFIILSLPMLLFYKKQKIIEQTSVSFSHIKEEYKNVFVQAKALFIIPGVSMFLLAYFFFNDAVLTLSNNFPIVVDKVFNAPDIQKTFLLILILVTSVIGSLICGSLGDHFGLKRVLLWILFGWIIIIPLMGISPNITILGILVTFMGILFGGVWAVSRALLSKLIPLDKLNYGFSFYTISERFASFLGPLTWSGIVVFTSKTNGLNYRFAIISMTIFIIVGFLFMRKVK
ncbi:MAG: MFS transporter [Candidatus Paceibacterota bacterium]